MKINQSENNSTSLSDVLSFQKYLRQLLPTMIFYECIGVCVGHKREPTVHAIKKETLCCELSQNGSIRSNLGHFEI